MNALLVQIADAVAAMLNDPANQAGLSQTFTAQRARVPEYDTASDSALRVFVFGLTEGIDFQTRGLFDHQYGVKVAIYKKIDTDADSDAVDYLREQVCDLIKNNQRLTVGSDLAALSSIANDPVYDPAQLDKHKTFVSVISLTYRLPR
jgi:hypothetical protein